MVDAETSFLLAVWCTPRSPRGQNLLELRGGTKAPLNLPAEAAQYLRTLRQGLMTSPQVHHRRSGTVPYVAIGEWEKWRIVRHV
jgi:hypothetical protein